MSVLPSSLLSLVPLHALFMLQLLDALADMERSGTGTSAFYKSAAYSKAATAIRAHEKPITSGKQAKKDIKGVGEGTAARVDEIIKTGTIASLAGMADMRTKAVMALQQVPGLTAALAGKLYDTEGVDSVESLLSLQGPARES
jgi:DNA polymerase/3'-5' exonuclease PolX